jgi:hypothetical protein
LKAAAPAKYDRHGSMASSQTTAGRRGSATRARNDSGHTRPDESSKGSRILGSKAERHNKRGLARFTSGSKKQWQDGGEEGAVEQRKKTGGLSLMQGKQSSTTPSPAGPTPIPRWRLGHGRLRLGRQHPWLGLLRLRSGHARADDDEDVRLRPPPRMAIPQRLQPLPSSSLSDFGATAYGLGKIPQGGGGSGGDRRTGWDWGFIGRSWLGFLGGGWTAGGPWRPCLGHTAGIPRPRACSVRDAGCRPCTAPLRHGGEDRQGKGERWG